MPEETPNGSSARATNATIQAEIVALRERLDLIWNNHEREHTQHESAHTREHSFSQQAIDTAAKLAQENKEDANEWRTAMTDRERTFATKTDISIISTSLNDLKNAEIKRSEVERIEKEQAAKDRSDQNDRMRSNQWKVGILVGFIATVGSILINLAIRLLSATPSV